MDYEKAKSKVFVTLTRPDGYRGQRTEVGLALIDGTIYEVHQAGCHRCPACHEAYTEEDVQFLIDNHENFKGYRRVQNEHTNP